MAVTCGRCGNGRFEMSAIAIEDSSETATVLHCAACGQALGLSDSRSFHAALGKQQANLDELRRQMSEVREMLGKLTTSS